MHANSASEELDRIVDTGAITLARASFSEAVVTISSADGGHASDTKRHHRGARLVFASYKEDEAGNRANGRWKAFLSNRDIDC